MKFIKNLIWLIKHKDEIERLLESKKIANDKRYAVGNVPEFQMKFVNSVLNEKE